METLDKEIISRLVDESFIFKSLEGFVRARLKELAKVKAYAPGDDLINEDDEGREMMILASGLVGVSQIGGEGDVVLAQLKPGAVIGEVSVITGAPRTSTVTALEESLAITFSTEVIHDLCELHPKVHQLLIKLIEGRARQSVAKLIQ